MKHRWVLALSLSFGCSVDDGTLDPDRFPCGDRGGSCDRATEMCVIEGEGCSKCEPLPTACDADASCDCLPPGNDPAIAQCVDAGSCELVDDGLELTCAQADGWGCG